MAGIIEWLGLIGVVLGGGLGYASSTLQENLRRRHEDSRLIQSYLREDEIRLENRRFDAYTAVSTAVNRVHAVAKYPALASVQVKEGKPIAIVDTVAYRGQLTLSYESFNATLSPAFLLTTSGAVYEGLKDLASSTRDLMEGIAASDRATMQLLEDQRRALIAVEAAIKQEIGLSP